MPFARFILAAALLAAGVAAWAWRASTDRSAPNRMGGDAIDREGARFAYVTTAHQLGVVGYRDPVGAIAPDGTRVAVVEGRRLFVEPIGGGARIEVAAAEGQIRHVSWLGDALIYEGVSGATRWWLVRPGEPAAPLFGSRIEMSDQAKTHTIRVEDLRQLAGSPDGREIAGIAAGRAGWQLWRIRADITSSTVVSLPARASFPAWTWGGEVACVLTVETLARLSLPCGQPPGALSPDIELVGPLAFSPDDRSVYFASPNGKGTVDLWVAERASGLARQLSGFTRDTYAPSVARDGAVIFKTQTYRTSVAEIDMSSRGVRQLTAFQAETPSYDPRGQRLAVTFGTWRRVIDDARYPDIAQDIGLIAAGPGARLQREPLEIIARSDSEDQAMAWSPNGKWIAFHSHREQSDDIWLRSADGAAGDRRISFLGRGAEVGWPRWSPDGRHVLFDGASPKDRRSVVFVAGIDQETGQVAAPPAEIAIAGMPGESMHAEWLPDSKTIAGVSKERAGEHVLYTAPASGGPARIIHRVRTEHDFPGLAVSPDGRTLAFVAPASDGYFQIFTLPLSGGTPAQLTIDPSHKSQPAWSPDGSRLAFTIWEYFVQFWAIPR